MSLRSVALCDHYNWARRCLDDPSLRNKNYTKPLLGGPGGQRMCGFGWKNAVSCCCLSSLVEGALLKTDFKPAYSRQLEHA